MSIKLPESSQPSATGQQPAAMLLPEARRAVPEAHAWSGGVLEFAGRDALAFAQAQLTSDVRLLADGHWQWSAWLTAKGRVVALGALLQIDAERLWWLLPDHPASTLAEALRRFVFRSKVALSAREDLALRGSFRAPQAFDCPASGNLAAQGSAGWALDLSGATPRTLWVSDRTGAPLCDAQDLAPPARWACEDLAHGLPRLPVALAESHTPQMLGLDRLHAYSVKKGCYPGQEIVARTHFLGQAKRKLHRMQADAAFVVGETLYAAGQPVGSILCAASDGGRHEALALLPIEVPLQIERAGAGVTVARLVAFAEGLAR